MRVSVNGRLILTGCPMYLKRWRIMNAVFAMDFLSADRFRIIGHPTQTEASSEVSTNICCLLRRITFNIITRASAMHLEMFAQ